MLVMSSPDSDSARKKKQAEITENSYCPELEFDMWDGQFEFVGNAYDAGLPTAADDMLDLPKISRSPPFGVQKVISSLSHSLSFFSLDISLFRY